MTLTRDALEQGFMRHMWHAAGGAGETLSDEALAAGADAALDAFGPGDPWVFAYGSLIWNPLFHHAERRCATLHGYHRRFCLWSRTTRGTPQKPGLVLGLDYGGCCRGVAFRIDRSLARAELRLLWKREMLSNSYAPRWVPLKTGASEIRGLAFVVNRSNPGYAGRLSLEEVARVMNTASGMIGSSRDYLRQTVEGLRQEGLSDPLLFEIEARVRALAADPQPAGATDLSFLTA